MTEGKQLFVPEEYNWESIFLHWLFFLSCLSFFWRNFIPLVAGTRLGVRRDGVIISLGAGFCPATLSRQRRAQRITSRCEENKLHVEREKEGERDKDRGKKLGQNGLRVTLSWKHFNQKAHDLLSCGSSAFLERLSAAMTGQSEFHISLSLSLSPGLRRVIRGSEPGESSTERVGNASGRMPTVAVLLTLSLPGEFKAGH